MTQFSRPSAPHSVAVGAGTGDLPYFLTLCQLAAPVSIRIPDSSPLRRFEFFMSRSRQGDGSERLNLHMGYFESLAEAEKWAHALRSRYPGATAARIPQPVPQHPGPGVPVLQPPSSAQALTDTQVLRILDTRRVAPAETGKEERTGGISLVGPDDTDTRRALKEAVARGAPVSFAVQLLWSVSDIDLANVPSLSIFRAYTLYKATGTREGRQWHCLRLGFFQDAISAKQMAYYVRSHFASVAVVPVPELERAHADECRIDTSSLDDDFQRSIDKALETDRSTATSKKDSPQKERAETGNTTTVRALGPKRREESLEQTLEMLAANEMWNDPESLSETGVRHLRLEVRKKPPR